MRILKSFYSNILKYLLWLVLSTILWAWIFSIITDVPKEQQVVLYAQVGMLDNHALDLKLEEDMPEGLRRIRTRTFLYAMVDDGTLVNGDLFILPESKIADCLPGLAPISADGPYEYYCADGAAYGIKVYDAATGQGTAQDYIRYPLANAPEEDFYLFFGAQSVHHGAHDNAADQIAERLLTLDQEKTP